ncbi:hypothetical protein BDP27DRAFT_159640 [Rhodocollybia butyracea]|uniref:Uncharacterized protein n=1 Tax=Rhodocollybia butyracea TaxID=206335 RepID=A0A9P5PJI4_9AGAR|nr:hypothetical protein BDP27DRAFT_159640 [Rhodocollybia butyracea]
MSVPKPARNISLPASLVENLVRIQAEELKRLKKRLDEAQVSLGILCIITRLHDLTVTSLEIHP